MWPVFLAAPTVLTGLQAILPSLPLMQAELGLSDTSIAMVTGVFLLPGVVLAVPAGMLADRYGRRTVLVAALLIFGGAAAVGLSMPLGFGGFLAVRLVQGAAFAAVLSVTITIIGDEFEGPTQVTGQGIRSTVLKLADGGLPILGGALATISWRLPMWTQLAALPVAALVWWRVDESRASVLEARPGIRRVFGLALDLPVATLLAAGFFRFFFKFTYLTYVPILAVGGGSLSVLAVGGLLGLAALAAAITGPAAGVVTRRLRPSTAIGLAVGGIGVALSAASLRPSEFVLVASAVIFGVSDGIFGVVQTSLSTQVPPPQMRATFIGLAATLRNLGKFAAPTSLGVILVWVSVQQAFRAVGLVALASTTMVVQLRKLQGDVSNSERVGAGIEGQV